MHVATCGGEEFAREGSSRPRISMMESADAPKSDHRAGLFDGPTHGRVAAKGHVRAIVMPLAEHDQVIEQLSAQCADPSFGETVLPRRARSDSKLAQAESFDSSVEHGAEHAVAIADQALDRWRIGASASTICCVSQERLPRLRRRAQRSFRRFRHVLRDGVLADDEAELRELARDPAPAPRRVLACHPPDERHDLVRERRTADAARFPSPKSREGAAVPCDHRRRFHDREHVRPARPHLREHDPERAIDRPQLRPGRRAVQDCELLP